MGLRRGTGNGPLVVVAAHLDTVFPAGTNVTVRREGTKLFAPGIGDDTRSLAVLLGFMRAMAPKICSEMLLPSSLCTCEMYDGIQSCVSRSGKANEAGITPTTV